MCIRDRSFAEKIQAQLERKDYISQIEACVFENGQNQSVQGKTALCGLLSIYQSLEPLDLEMCIRDRDKIKILAGTAYQRFLERGRA